MWLVTLFEKLPLQSHSSENKAMLEMSFEKENNPMTNNSLDHYPLQILLLIYHIVIALAKL